MRLLTLAAAAALTTSSAFAHVEVMSADILGGSGEKIGSIELRGGKNAVVMRVDIQPGSLTPGWHGIHLHAVGDCSDHGVFKHSKGHVGKIKGGHGLLNDDGPEAGDLTNLWVANDGSAKGEFASTTVSLSGEHGALRDSDGSAVVIHANADDHLTQPIGGAGPRVACAVIR